MQQKPIQNIVFAFLLIGASVSINGCSVFRFVGNAISSGYEEVVSYFNAYYNAQKKFNEAQDEVFASYKDAREKRDESQLGTIIVPLASPATKPKFNIVIDKCSQILSFYPKSSVVISSLMLIGKSYFYQGEYVKAERKFTELISRYPESSFILEAQLWLIKTLERLKKYNEGLELCALLIEDANKKDEPEFSANAYAYMAIIYRAQGNNSKAIECYEKAVQLSDNDNSKNDWQLRLTDTYFLLKQYEKAVDEYSKALQYSPDVYSAYYARVQRGISLRYLKQFNSALDEYNQLLADYRFINYSGFIRFERGLLFLAQGGIDEAFSEFLYVDSTSARTEAGYRAAFEIARLYEHTYIDYSKARTYYIKASATTNFVIGKESRLKDIAFGRYFELRQKYIKADSVLLYLQNKIEPPDTILLRKDSLNTPYTKSERDSIFAKRDSIRSFNRFAALDSLKKIVSSHTYDIGGVFYSDLNIPDSALYYYNISVSLYKDSIRTPGIYFVTAEIIRNNPQREFGSAEAYFQKIVNEYPNSPYAALARQSLGLPPEEKRQDPAIELYNQAEQQLERGNCKDALSLFKIIQSKHQRSSLAPKAQFAIAYTYEYCFKQPDSALVHYKKTVENYPTTAFAISSQRRIPPLEHIDSSTVNSRDSLNISRSDSTSVSAVDTARAESPKFGNPAIDLKDEQSKKDLRRTRRNPRDKEGLPPDRKK